MQRQLLEAKMYKTLSKHRQTLRSLGRSIYTKPGQLIDKLKPRSQGNLIGPKTSAPQTNAPPDSYGHQSQGTKTEKIKCSLCDYSAKKHLLRKHFRKAHNLLPKHKTQLKERPRRAVCSKALKHNGPQKSLNQRTKQKSTQGLKTAVLFVECSYCSTSQKASDYDQHLGVCRMNPGTRECEYCNIAVQIMKYRAHLRRECSVFKKRKIETKQASKLEQKNGRRRKS